MKTRNQRPTAPRFGHYDEIPGTYVGLCQMYLPRPIHSATEARVAGEMIAALAGFPLNDEQEDYLEAVSHFADEYDRARQPALPAADGLGVLRHLLEDRGQSGADLARFWASAAAWGR
ncbi:MAG TPA: hypothetical protein PLX89_05700 [Verrucomicrobiota bacterium]|nr:hypothetical protein [Verrucomicrobiales bacterium]HRI12482.1 hypothetical protein [Verrucomicrobiota bacterium]